MSSETSTTLEMRKVYSERRIRPTSVRNPGRNEVYIKKEKIPQLQEPGIKLPENPETPGTQVIPEKSNIPGNPVIPEKSEIHGKSVIPEKWENNGSIPKPQKLHSKNLRRASTKLNFRFEFGTENKNSENKNSEKRRIGKRKSERRQSTSWAITSSLLPVRNRAQSVGGRKNKEGEELTGLFKGPEDKGGLKTEIPDIKKKKDKKKSGEKETEEKTVSRKNSGEEEKVIIKRKNSHRVVDDSLENFLSNEPKTNEDGGEHRKNQIPEIPENNSEFRKRTFKDLPDSVKKKVHQLKIDQTLLEENVEIVFHIASFLYKKSFPHRSPHKNNEPRRPYANPEILEFGKSELKIPEKPLKKLYKSDSLVGAGGYGRVYMARDNITKERVAVKKIPHNSEKVRNNNFSEIGFASCCNHPNIVKYYCSFLNVDPKKELEEVWMVFQYMHGGTLSDAARGFKFDDRHIAFISRELCKGIKYLHDRNWCHRDIKSTNIMMDTTGVIKLIDFGLCADMSEGPRTKMLGSSFWIAPEMIRREPHTLSADIWSLAVCILELYLTLPPHGTSSFKCMFYAATVGLADVIPDFAEKDAKDWLKKCLVVDPKKRATVDELLAHPWVNQPDIEIGISDIFRSIFLNSSLNGII